MAEITAQDIEAALLEKLAAGPCPFVGEDLISRKVATFLKLTQELCKTPAEAIMCGFLLGFHTGTIHQRKRSGVAELARMMEVKS